MILVSKLLRVWPPFRGFIATGGFHVDEQDLHVAGQQQAEAWISGAREADAKTAGAQEAEIVT